MGCDGGEDGEDGTESRRHLPSEEALGNSMTMSVLLLPELLRRNAIVELSQTAMAAV